MVFDLEVLVEEKQKKKKGESSVRKEKLSYVESCPGTGVIITTDKTQSIKYLKCIESDPHMVWDRGNRRDGFPQEMEFCFSLLPLLDFALKG